MSIINNQTKDLNAIAGVNELTNETAATCSGGTGPDVVLYSGKNLTGRTLKVNNPIKDLRRYHFNNITSSFRVNRGKWNLYTGFHFKGYSTGFLGKGAYNLLGRLNNAVSSINAR
jgi:Beta/Gamma crystallin